MNPLPLAFAAFAPGDLPAWNPQVARSDDGVDLWAFRLDTPAPLDAWLDRLSAAERDRAARFVRDRDRQRFAVAHAVLRAILGAYLRVPPLDVDIALEARGKPLLGPPHAASDLAFNLAHSHAGALVGVARGRRLGVDLELATDDVDVGAIAQRFFTAEECGVIAPGRPGDRQRFYRHWVAKEAVMKAHGGGMAIPLHDIGIVCTGDGTAEVRSADPHMPGPHWRLRLLEGPGAWHAAVAASGGEFQLRLMTREAPPAMA